MKTQISRNSHQSYKRYSAVYQQQGRMLTDDDWNVMSAIIKERLDDVVRDVIGSGSPRERGVVGVVQDGVSTTYQLQWGNVYVNGIAGELRAHPKAILSDPQARLVEYAQQADFPSAPPITATNYVLYLDVWERAVTSIEDVELRDPGLHGADTCTRSQTMVQLKWCPADIDPEDPAQNPGIGDALLSLSLRAGATDSDPCDPCAEEIELQERVGSYLFRVEVHDVVYDQTGAPTQLTLKWSSENGAEHFSVDDVPSSFTAGAWVYEFTSGEAEDFATEKHLGFRLDTNSMWSPSRGQIEVGYPEVTPSGYSLVRRWDGYCVLQRNGAVWQLAIGSQGALGADRGVALSSTIANSAPGFVEQGTSVRINLDAIELSIDLDSRQLLAGDYWLAPVREAVHVSGDVLLDGSAPQGVRHHYLTLVSTSSGAVTWSESPWSAETLRALRFPPLTDLNAHEVGYSMPLCSDAVDAGQATVRSLLEGALGSEWADPGDINPSVRDILDTLLCRMNAAHVPIEQNAQLCPTLQDPAIESVQDALNALCVLEADSCATFTVFPRPGWESVFSQIGAGADAHICFREGVFDLSDTLVIQGKGHLCISGAGAGTRIVCQRRETALRFEDCVSVNLRDLAVESGAIARTKMEQGITGAVTAIDCPHVHIESASLKCAGATRFGASCLTVSHDSAALARAGRERSLRVKACSLSVGHFQTGMLLLNLDRVQVEDNELRVRPKPESLSLPTQLKDPLYRASVRRLLIHDSVIRDFSSDAALDSSVRDLRVSGRRVQFRSPVDDADWMALLESETNGVTVRSNQHLLDIAKNAAERILEDASFRSGFSDFKDWYLEFQRQNPAVAYAGIVCGGRVAKEVRIVNNTLFGVLEGIHIGVGEERVQVSGRFDMAGTVHINGNSVHVMLPPGYRRRRGGIFVGNCNHLSAENNHITVQRFPLTDDTAIDGIRVWGHLGRIAIVRQNYMNHCTTGVRVNPVAPTAGVTSQWLVGDNMMPSAAVAVAAPSSVRRVSNFA